MKRYGRTPKAIQTNDSFSVTTYLLKHLRLAGTEGAVVLRRLMKVANIGSLIHRVNYILLHFVALCYCLFQYVRWRSRHLARSWRLESLHMSLKGVPLPGLLGLLKACGDVLKIRKPVYVCQGPCTLQWLVPKRSAGKLELVVLFKEAVPVHSNQIQSFL